MDINVHHRVLFHLELHAPLFCDQNKYSLQQKCVPKSHSIGMNTLIITHVPSLFQSSKFMILSRSCRSHSQTTKVTVFIATFFCLSSCFASFQRAHALPSSGWKPDHLFCRCWTTMRLHFHQSAQRASRLHQRHHMVCSRCWWFTVLPRSLLSEKNHYQCFAHLSFCMVVTNRFRLFLFSAIVHLIFRNLQNPDLSFFDFVDLYHQKEVAL